MTYVSLSHLMYRSCSWKKQWQLMILLMMRLMCFAILYVLLHFNIVWSQFCNWHDIFINESVCSWFTRFTSQCKSRLLEMSEKKKKTVIVSSAKDNWWSWCDYAEIMLLCQAHFCVSALFSSVCVFFFCLSVNISTWSSH